jgi:hypothetical protein
MDECLSSSPPINMDANPSYGVRATIEGNSIWYGKLSIQQQYNIEVQLYPSQVLP